VSWNDIFGPETKKISSINVLVPRDKYDRLVAEELMEE